LKKLVVAYFFGPPCVCVCVCVCDTRSAPRKQQTRLYRAPATPISNSRLHWNC